MSEQERRQEVAESACASPGCPTCVRYIETGRPLYRPVSRKGYLSALRRSYPGGIPANVLPAWAEASDD